MNNFKSLKWLTMKNSKDEQLYKQIRLKGSRVWIISLSILSTVISLIGILMEIKYLSVKVEKKVFPFDIIMLLTFVFAGINLILTILILSIRNEKAKKYIYYLQYFLLNINFFSMNFSISYYKLDPQNHIGLYGIEALVKIFNHIGFLEFIDAIIITAITIFVCFPLYFFYINWSLKGVFIYPYVFYLLTFISVSYYVVYIRKTSFFLSQENIKKTDWFRNIIENMKSGFVYVKENKICLINKVMTEIIKKNVKIKKLIENFKGLNNEIFQIDDEIGEKFFEVEENSRKVLRELLTDIKTESYEENKFTFNSNSNCIIPYYNNNNPSSLLKNANEMEHIKLCPASAHCISFFEEFKKNSLKDKNKFTMIGIKSFEIHTEEVDEFLTLEVYCRYHIDPETKKDEFEIIFNDITKAKEIEEKKSDMKYKSIFLSKVAHEFKNPLICITELVNQLSENFKQIEMKVEGVIEKCEDNLHQINSFSNYLMILIRDFDYFSQKKIMMKKITLEKEECDLKEILTFCNEIALSLLKRNGKSNNIVFELDIKQDIPDKIISDENRLKQVLVNLISNSIKFTNQGKVILRVKRKDSQLVFCVSDTGVGIDPNNKKNIFAPYSNFTKSNVTNPFGSGLGLSIIFDLTNALGTQIDFKSEINKGSDFFFSIPIEVEIEHNISNKNEIKNFSRHSEKRLSQLRKQQNTTKSVYNNIKALSRHNCVLEQNKSTLHEKKHLTLPVLVSKLENSFYIHQNFRETFNNTEVCINKSEGLNLNLTTCDGGEIISERKKESTLSLRNLPHIFPDTKLLNKTSLISCSAENTGIINPSRNKSAKENNKLTYTRLSTSTLNDKYKTFHIENNYGNNIVNNKTVYILSPNIDLENKINNNEDCLKRLNRDNTIVTKNTNENSSGNYKSSDVFVPKLVSEKNKILTDHSEQFFNFLHLEEGKEYLNVIVVDDEKLTRCSNKRLISNYAKSKNLKINFLEAEDGIECLYILYACIKRGVKISCVLSDQNMTFMNGSTTALVLKELAHNETFLHIPFYIVTAYEDENILRVIKSAPITDIFSKPLKQACIKKILGI